MLTEVFGTAEPDKYKRAADERSGLVFDPHRRLGQQELRDAAAR